MKVYCEIGDNSQYINTLELPKSNNISQPDIKEKVQNPKNSFLLGSTPLYKKANAVQDKVNYFISEQLSNEQKKFSLPLEITMQFYNYPDFVIIYFDTFNKNYPSSITVKTYGYSDNLTSTKTYDINTSAIGVSLRVPNQDRTKKAIVTINDWSEANSPLIITGITTKYVIKDLISLQYSCLDRTDALKPSWGIKSNTGSIKFIDTFNIAKFIEKTVSNCEIRILLENNYGVHLLSTFRFDNQKTDRKNMECEISLKDELSLWQDIKKPRINIHDFEQGQTTASELINKIYGYDVLHNSDENTQAYLQKFIITYPYLAEGSLWSQFAQICEATGCYICLDENGLTFKFYYNNGR